MLDAIGLPIGRSTKVGDALTATGTARVAPFSIIAPPGPHKVLTSQVGATVISGNIEVSEDGQATWDVLAAFDFIANVTIAFDAYPGAAYRFNVTALTTTPADIFAVLS